MEGDSQTSLAASLRNRKWKYICTGGSLKETASANGVFSLAVPLSEPPVQMYL